MGYLAPGRLGAAWAPMEHVVEQVIRRMAGAVNTCGGFCRWGGSSWFMAWQWLCSLCVYRLYSSIRPAMSFVGTSITRTARPPLTPGACPFTLDTLSSASKEIATRWRQTGHPDVFLLMGIADPSFKVPFYRSGVYGYPKWENLFKVNRTGRRDACSIEERESIFPRSLTN